MSTWKSFNSVSLLCTFRQYARVNKRNCVSVGVIARKLDESQMESKIVGNGASEAQSVPERAWKEIKIPMPWGHISGKWWGPSGPQPVLAMHGWQDNAGTWDNLMPLLPHDIPVFCIDLPGHGLSSHYPKGQFYFLTYEGAIMLRRISKYFGWKKMIILGHSMGGLIGFVFAALYPDCVEKLIQVDVAGPLVRPPATMLQKSADCIDKFLKYEELSEKDMPCYDYADMLDMAVDAYKGSVTREACKVMLKRGTKPSPSGAGLVFCRDPRLKVAYVGGVSYDHVMEMADNVRCKLLNIRALPYNVYDKAEYYEEVIDRVRKNAQVEYHEVSGTHHLHLNTPHRVAEIMSKFLKAGV